MGCCCVVRAGVDRLGALVKAPPRPGRAARTQACHCSQYAPPDGHGAIVLRSHSASGAPGGSVTCVASYQTWMDTWGGLGRCVKGTKHGRRRRQIDTFRVSSQRAALPRVRGASASGSKACPRARISRVRHSIAGRFGAIACLLTHTALPNPSVHVCVGWFVHRASIHGLI